MRIVADTNTIVSGLLWHGPSRKMLDVARAGHIQLYTSPILLNELEDVLQRPKFSTRLTQAGSSARTLASGYAALARVIRPTTIKPVIDVDPDDDAVLACAISAQAEVVVSGDSHLLTLASYEGIPIIKVVSLFEIYSGLKGF